jgi:drug/metabolite transporter (DMT)-like permease
MPKTLKYAFLVFLGGACYGVMVPLVRTAHALGFTVPQVMFAQYGVGTVALGLVALIFTRQKMPLKQVLQLLALGVPTAGISFCYYHALTLLSSAAALTLLFQFVWMGVLFDAIVQRKLPSKMTILAVLLVVGGTFFAAGIFEESGTRLNALGVVYGLASAVLYTAFLHLSSKIATDQPTTNRVFFTTVGSFVATICITPSIFTSLPVTLDFVWIALPLALIGIVAPIYLIQKAAPKIPVSITTIMASSELPSGIIFGVIFLSDSVSHLEVLGVIVILVGIVLSQMGAVQRRIRLLTAK